MFILKTAILLQYKQVIYSMLCYASFLLSLYANGRKLNVFTTNKLYAVFLNADVFESRDISILSASYITFF